PLPSPPTSTLFPYTTLFRSFGRRLFMARPGRGLRVPSALPGRHCHPDGGAAAVAVLEIPVRAEHRLQNRRARGTQSHHPHAHHLHRAHVHLPVPVERTHPRPVTPSSPRLGL